MIFLIGIAAAAAGAVLAFWLARASAQRQLAEQRAALAAELAAAKRDNEWLTGQITRERAALGAMREAFQSLAADALNSNRGAFLDLARTSFEGFQKEATLQFDSRQKAIDGLVQPHRRDAEEGRRQAWRGGTRAARGVCAGSPRR